MYRRKLVVKNTGHLDIHSFGNIGAQKKSRNCKEKNPQNPPILFGCQGSCPNVAALLVVPLWLVQCRMWELPCLAWLEFLERIEITVCKIDLKEPYLVTLKEKKSCFFFPSTLPQSCLTFLIDSQQKKKEKITNTEKAKMGG